MLFSVLVLHWVTHQDDDGLLTITKCGGCDRSVGGAGAYSLGSAAKKGPSTFDHEMQRGFGGQVITNCEAATESSNGKNISIPMEGIMTRTEFTRDVESLGDDPSDVDLPAGNKRETSTDNIRDSQV